MSELILDVSDLCISLGDQQIIRDVSFNLEKNSVLGLVGESGSGKTLTALSMVGLLPVGIHISSGKIRYYQDDRSINLHSINRHDFNAIRGNQINMIFQEPMTSLNPSMKCGKQALEPLMIHKKIGTKTAREKVLHLFNEVHLPNVKRIYNAWPHELSGGQRQRVMIAMALTTEPKIIIADEPTTALDVTVQKKILDLLDELKNKYNLNIIFISHDLQVINHICDNVAVMYKGRIVENGSTKQIMDHPVDPYTRGLIACKPSLTEKPYRLPTVSQYLRNEKPVKPPIKSQTETINNEVLLKVCNLTVGYGKGKKRFQAIKNLSFEVFKGETLGLVGESGCGKTTLGRAILQLIESEDGNISYRGKPLNQIKKRELRKIRNKIQIIFQDPYSSLNPGKTIGNIIEEPLKLHNRESSKSERAGKVATILRQVGLSEGSINQYPHEFSGGQRQRIGIARALACNPEFIILDESVSALDVSIQAQVLNLLNDLKEEYQLTYIFISHDLTIVKYMSDRLIVMADGTIIESGGSEEIYKNPTQPYTMALLNAIP